MKKKLWLVLFFLPLMLVILLGIPGTEAVLQNICEILIGFHWEEDALGCSKQIFWTAHDGLQKILEGLRAEKIVYSFTGHDEKGMPIKCHCVLLSTIINLFHYYPFLPTPLILYFDRFLSIYMDTVNAITHEGAKVAVMLQ